MGRPVGIAVIIAVALVAWLLSGELGRRDGGAGGAPPAAEAEPAEAPLFKVAVQTFEEQPVRRVITANGRTAPARRVELKAEVDGRVVAVPAARGATVEAGEALVRLDERDRRLLLRTAEALLVQRESEHRAAERLQERGFQAANEAAAAAARLEEARSTVETARLALEHTTIEAPFAGVLDQRPVELGDYVDAGEAVATIIELDPLIVVADITEAEIAELRPGMEGAARTVGGEELAGRIRYIAREADPATRTFRVELEASNPGDRVEAGVSTVLRLPLEPMPAHRLPASLLVLDDGGRLGVKLVDAADTVRFHPARIVRAEADAVWVAGLPDPARLVTVGQGFVRDGQKVMPVPASMLPDSAAVAGAGR
jgi:membrane fusion protein, multidrug efflux system